MTITQVRDGTYLIDVVARAGIEDRTSPSRLRTLTVPLADGKAVPLAQLATFEYGQDWPRIGRRNRTPTLTVQADLAPGALPASVVAALHDEVALLKAGLPQGYSITEGGSVEESTKSLASLAAILPAAGLITIVILMVQLQSLQRVFLVLSVAPFGLIGVVGALLIAGKPLGFVSILGVVALVGMIVRNSVILVDQIEAEIARGCARWDAVVEATMHRLRPILLTAGAAILAMIPIASTVFWGPMAYAIMGGLSTATALTLVLLPALYVAWFGVPAPAGADAPSRASLRAESRLEEPAGPATGG
jgi:multidrug efflux pump subunit AcrB